MDIKSPKKLEESGEDQLTQSPSMGCVPFGFCTEALRTLYIKAVLGEQDSPWCSPPQPGLAWAQCELAVSVPLLPATALTGSRAGLSQAPLANFCNTP